MGLNGHISRKSLVILPSQNILEKFKFNQNLVKANQEHSLSKFAFERNSNREKLS